MGEAYRNVHAWRTWRVDRASNEARHGCVVSIEPMTVPHLATLGAWSASLRWEHVPSTIQRAARYQVLDMIAAAHSAGRVPSAAQLLADTSFLGPGRATVIATGARLAPGDAAAWNAAFSMVQDFDNIVWMGHTCHSAVWAALAVAEHEGRSSRDALTAVVVANEVAGRIGASCFLGPLNGQMTTYVHLVGAAAAAAHVLGLDETRTAHALAIALAQPTFALSPAFFAPTSKVLSAATPTLTGVHAAYHAAHGMTGALELLEDRRGFWHAFSFQRLPGMLGDLGDFWTLGTLTIKASPACHYFQTALSALSALGRARPLRLDEVRTIRVDTTKLACEVARFAEDHQPKGALTPVTVAFDLATALAVVLVAGQLDGAEATEGWLDAHAGQIAAWRRKIEVHHDPRETAEVLASAWVIRSGRDALRSLRARDVVSLVRRYRAHYGSSLVSREELLGWMDVVRDRVGGRAHAPAASPGEPVGLPFPARVRVTFEDGTHVERRESLPEGALAAGTLEATLTRKILAEVTPVLGESATRAVLEDGLRLEHVALDAFVRRAARAGAPREQR